MSIQQLLHGVIVGFSTCVSRCPPRSFPNKGGVCWPCHESCETCAGAGQDSCLTCAPAHLRVTDLAVCLQQCPDGYFESNAFSSRPNNIVLVVVVVVVIVVVAATAAAATVISL